MVTRGKTKKYQERKLYEWFIEPDKKNYSAFTDTMMDNAREDTLRKLIK